MRLVAAYLLAVMGSKEPNAKAIKDILGSVGVEADDTQLEVLLKKFAGKNVDELIEAGSSLLSSMGGGGGGAAPAAAAATGGTAAPAAEKEEEKKEEPEEESDDDMGFGLFD